MNRLIVSRLWPAITAAVRKNPQKCFVAVAYFGSGASKRLPLKAGSVLVIDMSRHAVTSGQTNPSEIINLLDSGVDVQTVANLHAKVYVAGKRAFVGSANASSHSANDLVEAALETTAQDILASCREFVRSLRGEVVTHKYARAMKALYVSPQFARPTGRKDNPTAPVPMHSPMWAIPLERIRWDAEDNAAHKKGLPTARSRLQAPRKFKVQSFCWIGSEGALARAKEREDLVLQVTKDGRRHVISAPGRLLHVRRYHVGRGKRAIVYVEVPTRSRGKGLPHLRSSLGPRCSLFSSMKGPRLVRCRSFVHDLLHAWPGTEGY